jgi:hypothetical protein
MWLPNDGSDAPKIPSGKGKRLIVLHAGMRSEGLIDVDLSHIITPIIGRTELFDYHLFFYKYIQDQ